jgi:pyruvate carboxylase
VKVLAVSDPHEDGARTVFFELNGRPREVDVRDRALRTNQTPRRKADATKPGEIGAPLPGLVTTIAVKEGDTVEKGERILVIEAMKMQSTVYATISGKVSKLAVHPSQQVEAKDLLTVLE